MDAKNKEEFLRRYKSGERHFVGYEMNCEELQNEQLDDVIFEGCWLAVDFRNTSLRNARFVDSNIKTTDFRGANLTNACISGCLVEATRYRGAKMDNLSFKANYCHGSEVNEDYVTAMIEFENKYEA